MVLNDSADLKRPKKGSAGGSLDKGALSLEERGVAEGPANRSVVADKEPGLTLTEWKILRNHVRGKANSYAMQATLRRTLGPSFRRELQEVFAMDHKHQLMYINTQIERVQREGKRELMKRLNLRPAAAEKIIPLEKRKKE